MFSGIRFTSNPFGSGLDPPADQQAQRTIQRLSKEVLDLKAEISFLKSQLEASKAKETNRARSQWDGLQQQLSDAQLRVDAERLRHQVYVTESAESARQRRDSHRRSVAEVDGKLMGVYGRNLDLAAENKRL